MKLDKEYYQNLIEQLSKALLKEKNKISQILDKEFADVMVMLEQFKAYYELDNKEIMDIMEYKINRQIDRIEKGD